MSTEPSAERTAAAVASTGGASETAEEKIIISATINDDPSSTTVQQQHQPAEQQQQQQSKPRIVRRRRRNKNGNNSTTNEIIELDATLLETTLRDSNLPSAYSFEIAKTVQRILKLNSTHVALQMPEGLLLYASVIADVLQRLVAATRKASSTTTTTTTTTTISPLLLQVSILGDVTYGACCVDDLGAQALGCDLLVHYGHSCLVPIQHTAIPCLYVFVEITIDVKHLVECFALTMNARRGVDGGGGDDTDATDTDTTTTTAAAAAVPKPHVYLLGTIQFRHALSQAKTVLQHDYGYDNVSIPQAKPLSPGEVLGCTSPVLAGGNNDNSRDDNTSNSSPHIVDALVLFVADGRFHLESTLISNPHIPLFLRYDPYSKTMTEETYQHDDMHALRKAAIDQARVKGDVFGIILGTLGRQGNPAILTRIQTLLRQQNKRSFVMLASEITPAKLALFGKKVDVWVQIACPRLSVDWGHHLSATGVPVLNPYELFVCLDETTTEFAPNGRYPMDYYASAGGPWSNYHGDNSQRQYEHNLATKEVVASS